MLWDTLGDSLLGNLLTGKRVTAKTPGQRVIGVSKWTIDQTRILMPLQTFTNLRHYYPFINLRH